MDDVPAGKRGNSADFELEDDIDPNACFSAGETNTCYNFSFNLNLHFPCLKHHSNHF